MSELLVSALSSPLFGITLTLVVYLFFCTLSRKIRSPLWNPLLLSVGVIILFLLVTKIPYEVYMEGGSIINMMLTPITVALAVPLYKSLPLLKKNLPAVLCGIAVGVLTSFFSILLLSRAFRLEQVLTLSLFPKSVTTPIGVALSEMTAGEPAITVAAILFTGIFGAIFGPGLCRLFRITDPVAVGIAIGTSAHAIGTARALELGEVQGGFSSLAIGVAGISTVFLVPLLLQLFPV